MKEKAIRIAKQIFPKIELNGEQEEVQDNEPEESSESYLGEDPFLFGFGGLLPDMNEEPPVIEKPITNDDKLVKCKEHNIAGKTFKLLSVVQTSVYIEKL